MQHVARIALFWKWNWNILKQNNVFNGNWEVLTKKKLLFMKTRKDHLYIISLRNVSIFWDEKALFAENTCLIWIKGLCCLYLISIRVEKFHPFMYWNFSFIGEIIGRNILMMEKRNVSEIAWKYTQKVWNSIPHKIILDKSYLPKWPLLQDFLREELSKELLSKAMISIHWSKEVQKQLIASMCVFYGCMCAAFALPSFRAISIFHQILQKCWKVLAASS